jgi:hypothetical protein
LIGLLWVANTAGAGPVLVERILAVVEGRPVMLSEVRLMEQVAGRDAAATLEALIDERLMFREAARLPQAALLPEEEDRALASLRARAPEATAGVPERDLRPIARRQATIVKYVEFRFRPQVRVDEDAPPNEADQRAEQDLQQRIEAWVKELRAGADVRYNVDSPAAAPGS